MKYFLDTEFIEGFHKPLFGKRRHFIDLISIGIVAEDGRFYYAQSNEYDPKDADMWVQEHVIQKLYGTEDYPELWKTNAQIVQEVFEFCTGDTLTLEKAKYYEVDYESKNIEFYAYYADYDWVLFCSLFGRMIDLPKGFPMYCNDLKQTFDEKKLPESELKNCNVSVVNKTLKDHYLYPKQTTEHNALADAKWNYELYKFLKSL